MHKFMHMWVALAVSASAIAAEIVVAPSSEPALPTTEASKSPRDNPFIANDGPNKTTPAKPSDENPFIVDNAPLSAKPAISAEDVVRFSVIEGFLLAETTLPPSTPQMQRVAGMAKPVHIAITDRGRDTIKSGYYSPDMLQVNYVSNDGSKWTRTSLFTAINHLNLSRDTIAEGSEKTVQFIQTTQPGMAGKAVTLYLQSLNADGSDEKQSYSAETFLEFIRTYPAETTEYLRPMLETIGPQPQLFAVDDGLACTVFPESFGADAARRGAVLEQVKLLNADEFHKRQEATQALERMGVTAAAVLASLDRGTMPPEQAARVDAVISRIRPAFDVNVSQLRSDPGFLLDCLLSRDEALRAAAMSQLNKVIGRTIKFDGGSDEASRVKAVYELRAELLPARDPTTRPSPQ